MVYTHIKTHKTIYLLYVSYTTRRLVPKESIIWLLTMVQLAMNSKKTKMTIRSEKESRKTLLYRCAVSETCTGMGQWGRAVSNIQTVSTWWHCGSLFFSLIAKCFIILVIITLISKSL